MSASETLEVMRDNKEETKKSAAAEAKRRRMVSGARNNVSFSRALSRAALRSLTAFEGLFVFAGRDFAGDFFGVGFGDFVASGLGDAARRGDFAVTLPQAFKNAGYGDDSVIEVIAAISAHTFTNLYNHVHATEIDFPTPPST